MNPEEKAKELVDKMYQFAPLKEIKFYSNSYMAKQCALITVQEILNSNPYSNPFNTDVYSTYDYWFQVKLEIEKL